MMKMKMKMNLIEDLMKELMIKIKWVLERMRIHSMEEESLHWNLDIQENHQSNLKQLYK